MKLKKDFKLELYIDCQDDAGNKSCMEVLACVVTDLRAEGFLSSVFRNGSECVCDDEY
jgi:hypothetical protein